MIVKGMGQEATTVKKETELSSLRREVAILKSIISAYEVRIHALADYMHINSYAPKSRDKKEWC